MWERKHRPRTLGAVALTPENRRTFESYLVRRELPRDLILVGEPGHGKTTMAAILEGALAFYAHLINASGRGGVDVVRGEISEVVKTGSAMARRLSEKGGAPYRIIRLEEAQGMTPEALAALRTVIDQRPDWVRFIFTGNRLPPDEAVVDRCRVVQFRHIPVDERVKVIERILDAEGLVADPDTIVACATAAPTMRWLIDYAEQCFLERGHLEPPPTRKQQTGRERRDTKERTQLLLAVHTILVESDRSPLSTGDLLAGLDEVGFSFPGKQPAQGLANALRPLGITPKMFGGLGARGYELASVEKALARLRR